MYLIFILKTSTLIVVIYHYGVVGNTNEIEQDNDFERHEYYMVKKASSKMQRKFILETKNNTSRLQCQHWCNRKKACTAAAMNANNLCLLLGESDGNTSVTTAGMETISKIRLSGTFQAV